MTSDSPPSSVSPPKLTPAQLHALFDILTHHETYAEAESFKDPSAITKYGFPFISDTGSPATSSSSPILQHFLTRCILTVPGVRNLPPEFWNVKFQGIMAKMGEADLSESYDKGALGTRKTLATAASVLHSSLSRGLLGGVPTSPGQKRDLQKMKYDATKAEDLLRAWDDCVHELVYGHLVDELFDHATESEDFEGHSPALQTAAQYVIIHVASCMHRIFVESSEGQYLLKLLGNVQGMIPYSMVRQTLRVGNAATMINGIIRIFLAKVGVGAMTNWLGLTKDAEDGMNLLQRIISLVLSWDSSEFRKVIDKIESAKKGPSKEHLAALKEHLGAPRDAHAAMREISMAGKKSIVVAIFDSTDPKLAGSLSESQHAQCLEWYSASLSIRDRDEITKVLCKQNPDLFTSILRDAVSTFDGMIRSIHSSIDLREHISALESFLNDLLETSKPKKIENGGKKKKNGNGSATRPPSVEDYVALVNRNKQLCFNYLHQFAKSCTGVREQFRGWAKEVVKNFRDDMDNKPAEVLKENTNGIAQKPKTAESADRVVSGTGAGAMSDNLQSLFSQLPDETRQSVLASLDSHATYLSSLESISTKRMQHILDSLSDDNKSPVSMSGPGILLSRWEGLLDETIITPGTPEGSIRHGKDVKGQQTGGKTGAAEAKDSWDAAAIAKMEESGVPEPPQMDAVMRAMGPQFRDMVAGLTSTNGAPL